MSYVASGYNFDVQLGLAKSYDRVGLPTSFSETYTNLDIKGVQLESLGYISNLPCINWCDFSQLQKTVAPKLQKYLKNNARDLADIKIKALIDKNYAQLENFLEYEEFLGNSYFMQYCLEYREICRTMLSAFVQQGDSKPMIEFVQKLMSHEQC